MGIDCEMVRKPSDLSDGPVVVKTEITERRSVCLKHWELH